MHQSQGNRDDTQVLHELGMFSMIKRTRDKIQNLKALQSKKVKSVAARSGPSLTRMDSLLVKWDSPSGIAGTRSFLKRGCY